MFLEIGTLVPEFFQTKSGGSSVFRNWNAGSGVFQKNRVVPVFLEIETLVPEFFQGKSCGSSVFRNWSAGSGRFRIFSEGFRVIPLF